MKIGLISCEIQIVSDKVIHCSVNESLSTSERQLPVTVSARSLQAALFQAEGVGAACPACQGVGREVTAGHSRSQAAWQKAAQTGRTKHPVLAGVSRLPSVVGYRACCSCPKLWRRAAMLPAIHHGQLNVELIFL